MTDQATPGNVPLNDQLDVILLRKSAMGGGWHDYFGTAFLDAAVADMRAKDMAEEWVSYHPESVLAERMPGGRCAVGGRLYVLDESSAAEEHRQRGLKKLTADERAALGI